MSRRSGRIRDRPSRVMSTPSKTILPDVGSSNLVTTRPVVVLPHPDSPTRPRVSPAFRLNDTPSTARTAPTWRWKKTPCLMGKCFVSPSTASSALEPAISAAEGWGRSVDSVIPRISLQRREDLVVEDLATLRGPDVTAHLMALGRRLDQLRMLGLAAVPRDSVDVPAARVEHAALRHLDERRRLAGDRREPRLTRPVKSRHRAEQPPRVGHLRLVEQLID